METRIITEGLSSIGQKMASDNHIELIISYVIKDGKTYKENEIDLTKYYNELTTIKKYPTTAHANYHDLEVAFEKTLKHTDQILYLAACASLTGTYGIAKDLSTKHKDQNCAAFDTGAFLGMEGFMALEAAQLGKQGKTPQEIIKFLEQNHQCFGVLGVLGELKYLAHSGRIEPLKAFFGGLLSIKPIISLRNEEITAITKTRTQAQAIAKVKEYIHNEQQKLEKKKIKLGFEYTNNLDYVKSLTPEFVDEFKPSEVLYFQVSPALGTHLGPGTWGVSYYLYE